MTPNRETGLDGLRGLAAAMVFLYHLRWIAGEPSLLYFGWDWQPVLKSFDAGVCLFFVLSGYLLSGPFWDKARTGGSPDIGKFAIRRLARILPAYWVVLGVFALLAPSTYTFWGIVSLLLQTAGLHTFADFSYMGVVPVLWSIGIEMQFYALLPILFFLSRCVSNRQFLIPVALVGCVVMVDVGWRQLATHLAGIVPAKIVTGPASISVQASVFHYLKWFVVGILTAWTVRRTSVRRLPGWVWDTTFTIAVTSFTTVVLYSAEGEWRTVSTFGWPLGCLTCALLVFSVPRSRVAAFLFENRLMEILGIYSYGIYLWHWPIMKAVFGGTLPGRLGPEGAFWIGGSVTAAVTLLFAFLIHRWIELPAISWSHRQTGISGALRSIAGSLGWHSVAGSHALPDLAEARRG